MNILSDFPGKILTLVFLTFFVPCVCFSQWGPNIKLSNNAMSASLNENMGPCLAVSGDTIHVVWCDHRTHGSAIYYKRSIDTGTTWNAEIPITDTTGSATFPAIAVSGSIIHVVWLDSLLGNHASFYKSSLDGGNTWGPNFCLDSNTKFWPGVAAYGSVVVVSLNKEVDAGNTEVFFRRSIDNGFTWDSEQQISNANNRSEDPAIAILGSDIHLSWNDKRSGTMEIYYRHSYDTGLTWGPETPLTFTDSYTSMVCLDDSNVDVPYGNTLGGNFDVWLRQSSDTGSNFGAAEQLTNDPSGEAYPYLVRKGLNLHLVYPQFDIGSSSAWYMHSGDGGATWDSAVFLAMGAEPFIAITSCMLHVIYLDSGLVYYKRNPTGNCEVATGIPGASDSHSSNLMLTVFQSLLNQVINFEFTLAKTGNATLKIYDIQGREIATVIDEKRKGGEVNTAKFDASRLEAGIYLCILQTNTSSVAKKFVLLK